MGTKTISLADDAYEQLKAEKRAGESFSDVVRRLTAGVSLEAYHGVLGEETAAELDAAVERRRAAHTREHRDRVDHVTDALE